MNKKGIALTVLFVLCMMIMPCFVSAATIEYFGATSRALTDNTIGGKEITITATSRNTAAVYVGFQITNGSSLQKTYSADVTMKNSKFKFTNCTANTSGGWEVVSCNADANDPTIIHIQFKNDTGVSSTSELTDGYVGYLSFDTSEATSDPDKQCVMSLKRTTPSTENPKCKIDGDDYYCQDGQKCTKDEYEEQCPSTTENPQTGSFIPYVVIVAGIGVASGLYFLTKKNKIYHI